MTTRISLEMLSDDVKSLIQAASLSGMPIGAGVEWYEDTLPSSDFLWANGGVHNIADYPVLGARWGSKYGGDGLTTFGVPDKRDRVGVGKGDMGGAVAANRITSPDTKVLGQTGGVESVTLTAAQIPAHTHPVTDPGHFHSISILNGGGSSGNFGVGDNGNMQPANTDTKTTGITVGANTGGGGAHTNLQPFVVCNYIIRAR